MHIIISLRVGFCISLYFLLPYANIIKLVSTSNLILIIYFYKRWRAVMLKKMKQYQCKKEIISNIKKYIDKKHVDLETQYLSVKMPDGQNKNNDIYDFIDWDIYSIELMKVSVVILTANYYECEILNLNVYKDSGKKIKQLNSGIQLLKDRHIVKTYILEIDDYIVLHLHAPETGSNTPCGSADLVRYVGDCEFLDPSCIISFGICYGTDYKNFSLGDTLIAEKIYPWSIGIKINEDGWKIKCDDYVIDLRGEDAHLYDRIKMVSDTTQDLCPGQRMALGNMLTSEAVVSNEKIKIEAIENAYGCNIVGGEMEGYGLAKECIYYTKKPCIILKAICDWGAVKNIDKYIEVKNSELKKTYKDQIQAYTTYCAYRALNELFKKKAFQKKDTIALIYEGLREKYYSDASIRNKVLRDFVDKYLETNFKKGKQMSKQCKESVTNITVEEVISKYFTMVNCYGEVCYIFNEHCY